MNIDYFRRSLEDSSPPETLSAPLKALWHLAKRDWHRAHEIAQADPSREGSLVHAHLHRVEGDLSNAAYWYRKAKHPVSPLSIEEELWELVGVLLRNQAGA